MRPAAAPVVTFDVFSALLDSRTGATAGFAALAVRRGWREDPATLYDDWDRRNKAAHREHTGPFRNFRALATQAMAQLQRARGLSGSPERDTAELLASATDWPLWPDAAEGVAAVAARGPVALLSNVDVDVLAVTHAARLVPDHLTSEEVGAYKPHRAFYAAARDRFGRDLVHVAASARDVRGSLEASLRVVRVLRPDHRLDPDGPVPELEVDDLRVLPDLLATVTTGGRA
jgi:2-haloacid dehalogenase